MERVSVRREVARDADAVRERMHDIEPFMLAAGFDEVRHTDSSVEIANEVGPVTIELFLELSDDPDADLAYRQVDGIFEEMTTTYTVTEGDGSTVIEAETEFALDAAIIGSFLDATVIKRQRRRELTAQLDYLE
ncbi:SRPBCC family protein [Halobellus ordinarius]|uniref:SRPBCC family protein n=1 Tax=Halobellus ordinarius TaxID=3075120 RepID=UPI0028806303|nr:SRPBCC family protein [Halobellus sp. ZY16]